MKAYNLELMAYSLLRGFAFAIVMAALFSFGQQQTAAQAPAAAPVAEGLDREAFSFIRYDLKVTITAEQQALAVEGSVTLRNDTDKAQPHATLQISSSLDWQQIRIAGQPVEYTAHEYISDIDHSGSLSEAVLNLPQPVAPGGTIEIQIKYSGKIVRDGSRLEQMGMSTEAALASDWDEIGANASAVRGAGYVAWYPVSMDAAMMSSGNQLAETLGFWRQREEMSAMHAQFCFSPPPFHLIANGHEEDYSSSAVEQGRTVQQCTNWDWGSIGDATPTFAVGRYLPITQQAEPNIYSFVQSQDAAREWAEIAREVLAFSESWFGKTKRWARIVELNDPKAPPFISGDVLFTPLANSNPQLARLLLAKLLAGVSLETRRPWIREGAAYFAEALQRERLQGRAGALDELRTRLPILVEAERTARGHEPLLHANDEVFYRVKAMYCWWMLRDILGDETLQKAFAAYRAADDRDPTYMQRLMEGADPAKRHLDWFFDGWVYSDRGLPDFRIAAASVRQTLPGNYVVAVTVENLGDAAAEVPVIVRSGVAEQRARLLAPARSQAITRIPIGQYPTEVVVNDGSVPESNFENNTFKIPPREQ
jgi:hypothetical protein